MKYWGVGIPNGDRDTATFIILLNNVTAQGDVACSFEIPNRVQHCAELDQNDAQECGGD